MGKLLRAEQTKAARRPCNVMRWIGHRNRLKFSRKFSCPFDCSIHQNDKNFNIFLIMSRRSLDAVIDSGQHSCWWLSDLFICINVYRLFANYIPHNNITAPLKKFATFPCSWQVIWARGNVNCRCGLVNRRSCVLCNSSRLIKRLGPRPKLFFEHFAAANGLGCSLPPLI